MDIIEIMVSLVHKSRKEKAKSQLSNENMKYSISNL